MWELMEPSSASSDMVPKSATKSWLELALLVEEKHVKVQQTRD